MKRKTSSHSAQNVTEKKATGWGGKRANTGGRRDGAGRPRSTTITHNGHIAAVLSKVALVVSRNGHRFETFEQANGLIYYMIDDDRFDDYLEAAREFQRRANPTRYG